mmetsp:Transcript_35055/g.81987  ORF Transcript_35055/g.81987 Transcript_35055/m.81987 type:complete len:205 (-) Transcript_35055:313-927(-)
MARVRTITEPTPTLARHRAHKAEGAQWHGLRETFVAHVETTLFSPKPRNTFTALLFHHSGNHSHITAGRRGPHASNTDHGCSNGFPVLLRIFTARVPQRVLEPRECSARSWTATELCQASNAGQRLMAPACLRTKQPRLKARSVIRVAVVAHVCACCLRPTHTQKAWKLPRSKGEAGINWQHVHAVRVPFAADIRIGPQTRLPQ